MDEQYRQMETPATFGSQYRVSGHEIIRFICTTSYGDPTDSYGDLTKSSSEPGI